MRDISARGVYYNLELSPYRVENTHGDVFKFSSAKKLEIYARELKRIMLTVSRSMSTINKYAGTDYEIDDIIKRRIEISLYERVEAVVYGEKKEP